MSVTGLRHEARGFSSGVDLVLAGHRVRLLSTVDGVVDEVVAVVSPPCQPVDPGSGRPEWTLRVEAADRSVQPDTADAMFADRPVLTLPRQGPRFALVDVGNGLLHVAGRFRPATSAAWFTVDVASRETRVALPHGDVASRRWPDWLARTFFASRMLAEGWRLLHASAVAVGGRALLILAAQRGGKSTLAHRACVEQGAAFMADDLVLLGGDGTVVGWPTRIALPVELWNGPDPGRTQYSTVDGLVRARVLLTPPEHRRLVDVPHAGPAALSAVVLITPAADQQLDVVVEAVDAVTLCGAVEEAGQVPAQMLYLLDVLGLIGENILDGVKPHRGVFARLNAVPAACLRVRDPSLLGSVALWEPLATRLPMLKPMP